MQAQVDAAAQALEDLFAQSAQAMSGLSSYRYTTTLSVTDAEDGMPESGSIEVHGIVASADRQSLDWKDLDSGDQFSLIRVGERAWMREGEAWDEVPAMVADAMSQGLLIFSPVAGWSMFAEDLQTQSRYIGTETVNGVATKHYSSTYKEWAATMGNEVSDAQGDVWIAEEGFPARFRLAAEVADEDGGRKSVTWTMDMFDVGAALSVEAPQTASAPAI